MPCITPAVTCTFSSSTLILFKSTNAQVKQITVAKSTGVGGIYDSDELTATITVDATLFDQIKAAKRITFCYDDLPTPHHPINSVSVPA